MAKRLALAIWIGAIGVLGACEGGAVRAERERLAAVDAGPIAGEVHQSERDWAWVTKETWILAEIEGAPPLEGVEPSIEFAGHSWVSGSGGCNRIFASYERVGTDGLQLSGIGATRMACFEPEGVMQQESRFLYLLGEVNSYSTTPKMLVLESQAEPVLRFLRAER